MKYRYLLGYVAVSLHSDSWFYSLLIREKNVIYNKYTRKKKLLKREQDMYFFSVYDEY